MKPYHAQLSVEASLVRSLLTSQFPQITIRSIEKLGAGWDNAAYLINNELIFRFPQREIAVSLLLFENQLLPQLQTRLSLQLPNPIYIGHVDTAYPWVFSGYKKTDGISGCQLDLSISEYRDCARILGKFLRQLHDIDIGELELGNIKANQSPRIDKKFMCKHLSQRWLEVNKSPSLQAFAASLNKILAAIEPVDLTIKQPCLIHGDLYHRHLFFNNRKLIGVIDWGDMAFSHYIIDLGVVYQFLPPQVHDNFFNEYGKVSEALRHYARFLGLYSAITLLWYGSDIGDWRLIETSLQTLRWLSLT